MKKMSEILWSKYTRRDCKRKCLDKRLIKELQAKWQYIVEKQREPIGSTDDN